MKLLKPLFFIFVLTVLFSLKSESFAQQYPVLYFCESYGDNGEVGVSDRFTTGYLTVMVKSDGPLGLRDCSIQMDKYDRTTGTFSYYKKFPYSVTPDMKYIYFSKNEESDMNFEDPGIYRVFLLDHNNRTVASGLVEIISKY
ncbi:MAG TPA: hypothetical protein PK536_05180 [Ignavibacteria bacterium]|nr:hypothetical protein [Bacteroidota bacterium]HRI84824.1 hypothetical protein [Ignavibacteria bacterium]HRK00534.1 hypothetical protein [Ignavibacteria bacterium]